MADLLPGARVTAAQVMEIIATTLTEAVVNAMINTAHIMVEETLANKTISESLLEQIELWLAAHYVCARDPRIESVRVDEVSTKFQTAGGQGLSSTVYGQQAMSLDPTGSLAATSLKKAVIRSL